MKEEEFYKKIMEESSQFFNEMEEVLKRFSEEMRKRMLQEMQRMMDEMSFNVLNGLDQNQSNIRTLKPF